MHQKFADWYQPATFGHDRDTLELRWSSVEAVLEDLEVPQLLELVRLVYGRPLVSNEFMGIFRKHFKDNDPTFQSSGNDQEILILAGCVLAVCIEDNYDIGEVPLAILTSSICKKRVPKVTIDLVGMATDCVRENGLTARKRPSINKSVIPSCNESLEKEIERLMNTQDLATTIAVLQQIGPIQKTVNEEIILLHKVLNIQDEELQMLWWLVSGWSAMWNSTFNKIESKARPLLLAKEAASMCDEISESPSLKAVFSRVDIDGNIEVTIPEVVNSCGAERLKQLTPRNTVCSTIFPLHFAISRALETTDAKTWIPAWSDISGIEEDTHISSLDLALQFHRELKLIKLFEAVDE